MAATFTCREDWDDDLDTPLFVEICVFLLRSLLLPSSSPSEDPLSLSESPPSTDSSLPEEASEASSLACRSRRRLELTEVVGFVRLGGGLQDTQNQSPSGIACRGGRRQ